MSLLNLLEEFIMFEKIRKMKNKKGFTLVELIVVLVILAILAALLIPALTGYIDKANKEKVVAECRQVTMAAQSEITEAYGKGDVTVDANGHITAIGSSVTVDTIKTLAEAKNTWTVHIKIADGSDATVKAGTVVEVQLWDGTFGCTYTQATSDYDTSAPTAACDDTFEIVAK